MEKEWKGGNGKIKNEFKDKEMILSLEFILSLIIYNADKFHKG